jgi:membrane-bound lytic murein transglycosylase D
MRVRSLVLLAAAAVGGCATIRPAPPPPPAPAPAPLATAPGVAPAKPHIGCEAHPQIDEWESRLRTGRRDRVTTEHSMRRGEEYLPRLRAIVAEHGLPESLALLPAIESSFRSHARGPTGSRGLWQLEASTARRFGLTVNRKRDDRLDLERSTRAAVRYLRLLHGRYGDWPLALAAYNAGEGRVDKARRAQPGASFWELSEARRLPPISRDYVPRFLAFVRVVEEPVCGGPGAGTIAAAPLR